MSSSTTAAPFAPLSGSTKVVKESPPTSYFSSSSALTSAIYAGVSGAMSYRIHQQDRRNRSFLPQYVPAYDSATRVAMKTVGGAIGGAAVGAGVDKISTAALSYLHSSKRARFYDDEKGVGGSQIAQKMLEDRVAENIMSIGDESCVMPEGPIPEAPLPSYPTKLPSLSAWGRTPKYTELKYYDDTFARSAVNNWELYFTGPPIQGDSNREYIGNRIMYESLEVTFLPNYGAVGFTQTLLSYLDVWWDFQPAGTVPVSADVYSTGDVDALPEWNNRTRFKRLKRFTCYCDPTAAPVIGTATAFKTRVSPLTCLIPLRKLNTGERYTSASQLFVAASESFDFYQVRLRVVWSDV